MYEAIRSQVDKVAASQVFYYWNPVFFPQVFEFPHGNRQGEAHYGKVALMHLHEKGSIFPYGPFIICKVRAVGSPHLPEYCTASGHHVRNPEGAAYFYQLSPGDNHLPALGQGFKGDEYCCGIVVHHKSGLSACKFTKDLFHVAVPAAASALFQVVFQVGIVYCNLEHGIEQLFRQQ